MSDEHRKAIQEKVIPQLEKIAASDATSTMWKAPDLHFPIDVLLEEITAAGFEVDDDSFDTNGWQWDWWIKMEKNGSRYTLSGSGWYGGLKFYVSEEAI